MRKFPQLIAVAVCVNVASRVAVACLSDGVHSLSYSESNQAISGSVTLRRPTSI